MHSQMAIPRLPSRQLVAWFVVCNIIIICVLMHELTIDPNPNYNYSKESYSEVVK